MQQSVLGEASTNSCINLLNMCFLKAYYVSVTSAGARRSGETFYPYSGGGHALPGFMERHFLFFASKYSKLYMHHNWLNDSPIKGYLDSLQFGAIKDKTVNIHGQVSA